MGIALFAGDTLLIPVIADGFQREGEGFADGLKIYGHGWTPLVSISDIFCLWNLY